MCSDVGSIRTILPTLTNGIITQKKPWKNPRLIRNRTAVIH